jgi:hypothetical protein
MSKVAEKVKPIAYATDIDKVRRIIADIFVIKNETLLGPMSEPWVPLTTIATS